MTKAEQAEYNRKYHEANHEKIVEKQRKWQEAHPDYNRHYYDSNREVYAARARRYYEANKEKQLEYVRLYKNNKLSHTVYLLILPDRKMYVGSTIFLSQQISIHKQDSERWPNRKLYKSIVEVGGWEKVEVHVLIKDIPDEQLRQALKSYFINRIPAELSLNSHKTKRGRQ